jgi:predicted ATP-dependent endonuclease of OLD family
MDLVSVSVTGWRRFAKQTTLQTNGKLVSILGPNEAGKSSLLQAIRFLDSSDEAAFSDVARDSNPDDLSIVGYFYLTPEELLGARLDRPTRLVLTKKRSGPATIDLDPEPPERNLEPRANSKEQIDRTLHNEKFVQAVDNELYEKLTTLSESLSTRNETLSGDVMLSMADVADLLTKVQLIRFPKYVQALSETLNNNVEVERAPTPNEIAYDFLESRTPDILMFGPDERDLREEYSFEELATGIPVALENLSSVAKLDIADLIAAVGRDDAAHIETIRAKANRSLREEFDKVWSQSGVHATISIKGQSLSILIENDRDEFTALAERSDGFRQFVALQTFTMKERSHKPILLIDEAELHLHYDAQADLVQMLSRQQVSNKIIYTTHSAGCLPEDLGNGVRLVHRLDHGKSESRVINRFWGATEPGFSPLLIGMGASTLAFFPTRRALLVEGETEMLLLPTMLREALDEEALGFQVIPGLSRANKAHLLETKEDAKKVAYLVDGDAGGSDIRRQLLKSDLPATSIFSLPITRGIPRTLEDFISTDILVRATNQLIGKFSPGCAPISSKDIARSGRISSIGAKFKVSTKKTIRKPDLAYEILALINQNPDLKILDKDKRDQFRALSIEISSHFFGKSGPENHTPA